MIKVERSGVFIWVGRASFGALQGKLAAGTRVNSLLFSVSVCEGTFAYSAHLVCVRPVAVTHFTRSPSFIQTELLFLAAPRPRIHQRLRPASDGKEKLPCCGGDNGATPSL